MIAKEKVKQVAQESGQVALTALKVLSASSVAFPPLRMATATAVEIVDLVLKFRRNQQQWSQFAVDVQMKISLADSCIATATETRDDLGKNLENLKRYG
ncbi:hypothetical protein BDQ17DRAFT_489944 [Cyathus striatus]|nr:hypothetical protein BDQ17DRAFT_489944 [Cyathus striatus]